VLIIIAFFNFLELPIEEPDELYFTSYTESIVNAILDTKSAYYIVVKNNTSSPITIVER
jgi:hypothetical protein